MSESLPAVRENNLQAPAAAVAENVTETGTFKWSEKMLRAAKLVAEDEYRDVQIAEMVGVSLRHLERLKQNEEFRARVADLLAEFQARVIREGAAVLGNRVNRLTESWRDLRDVLRARRKAAEQQQAKHEWVQQQKESLLATLAAWESERQPDEAEPPWVAMARRELTNLERIDPGPLMPGQETGQVVMRKRYARDGSVSIEYETDTGTLAELRQIEAAAGRELGQIIERREISGPGGKAIETRARMTFTGLTDEEMDTMETLLEKAAAASEVL